MSDRFPTYSEELDAAEKNSRLPASQAALRAAISEAREAAAQARQFGQAANPPYVQPDPAPMVVHYHAAPAPKTGAGDILKWVMAACCVVGMLVALCFAAIALAIAAGVVGILAWVFWHIYTDTKGT